MKNASLFIIFFSLLGLSCSQNYSGPLSRPNSPFIVYDMVSDSRDAGQKWESKDVTVTLKAMPNAFDYRGLEASLLESLDTLSKTATDPRHDPKPVLEDHKTYKLVTRLLDRTFSDHTDEIIMLVFINKSLLDKDPQALETYLGLKGPEISDKWFIEYNVGTKSFQNFHY